MIKIEYKLIISFQWLPHCYTFLTCKKKKSSWSNISDTTKENTQQEEEEGEKKATQQQQPQQRSRPKSGGLGPVFSTLVYSGEEVPEEQRGILLHLILF